MAERTKSGSIQEFDHNWRKRQESFYNHWTTSSPQNQVQFAFKMHWEVFADLLRIQNPGSSSSLEVGCGRGSLSSFFAAAGWDTWLLDSSHSVLEIARSIFQVNGHKAHFIAGDANCLPFEDEQFDTVGSIGLLEHFEDVALAIREQWRIIKPGGWLLAYIVPERPDNLQKYFRWVNWFLKKSIGVVFARKNDFEKQPIYRNDYDSSAYLPIVESLGPEKVFVSGIYSMPMISHSPEFPFSLLPRQLERVLVQVFAFSVGIRRLLTGRHGWLCSERMGQAFLIAARKKST